MHINKIFDFKERGYCPKMKGAKSYIISFAS